MKENDKKMSAENPILGTQRYFWRKWRKMTENRPRVCALTIKMGSHYRKIENPGKSWGPVLPGAFSFQKTSGFLNIFLFIYIYIYIVVSYSWYAIIWNEKRIIYISTPYIYLYLYRYGYYIVHYCVLRGDHVLIFVY